MPEGGSSGPTNTTIITISSGNSYIVSTSINEWRIDLLVDTRSVLSILMRDAWDRLSPQDKDLTPSSRDCVEVDRNCLNVQRLCQVPIVILDKTFAIKVYLIDDITAQVILGLKFLEKNNVCIDTAAGRLTNLGGEVDVELKIKGERNQPAPRIPSYPTG